MCFNDTGDNSFTVKHQKSNLKLKTDVPILRISFDLRPNELLI